MKLREGSGYDVKAEEQTQYSAASVRFKRGTPADNLLTDFARDQEAPDWLFDRGADINRTDDTRTDNNSHNEPGDGYDYSLKLLDIVVASGIIQLSDCLTPRGAKHYLSAALHRFYK